MKQSKKALNSNKLKYVIGIGIILVLVVVAFIVHFTKTEKPVIVFKENPQLEKYTYLTGEGLETQIDTEKSNYDTFRVEFIRNGTLLDEETVRKEQIELYFKENKIPYPAPDSVDITEILSLLQAKDEMPLVGDIELRIIAIFSDGSESSVNETFKVVDTISPTISYLLDGESIENGDRIVLDLIEANNNVDMFATDLRFGEEIKINVSSHTSNAKEATQLHLEADDGVNEVQKVLYIYLVDEANVTPEQIKMLEKAGVRNLDRVKKS